ncbi:hypothetical protein HPB47_025174 [Ixodes persulcatus]|uniref:Uncharacterized protein n=1 Tax=Ixodes persulcatus TaxID=34615 RepID=A0AC60Q2W7_IXOPE|nr:hypothetical protein HPB47_025174 [Ixodes persulcatus]
MMSQIMAGCSEEMLRVVDRKFDGGEAVDMLQIAQGLSLDVISKCALAWKVNCQTNTTDPLLRAMHSVVEDAENSLIQYAIALPILRKIAEWIYPYASYYKITSKILNNVREVIEYRRSGQGSRTTDMIQLMLDAQAGKEGKATTSCKGDMLIEDRHLLSNSFLFLAAGFDTTALTLAFGAFLLAKYPEEQDRVFNEIVSVFSEPDTALTYDGIQKLKRLDMMIAETMRLYPPVVLFVSRCCRQDTTIMGQFIPAGVNVLVPTWHVHHDPNLWPDPYKFDPERFADEGEERRVIRERPEQPTDPVQALRSPVSRLRWNNNGGVTSAGGSFAPGNKFAGAKKTKVPKKESPHCGTQSPGKSSNEVRRLTDVFNPTDDESFTCPAWWTGCSVADGTQHRTHTHTLPEKGKTDARRHCWNRSQSRVLEGMKIAAPTSRSHELRAAKFRETRKTDDEAREREEVPKEAESVNSRSQCEDLHGLLPTVQLVQQRTGAARRMKSQANVVQPHRHDQANVTRPSVQRVAVRCAPDECPKPTPPSPMDISTLAVVVALIAVTAVTAVWWVLNRRHQHGLFRRHGIPGPRPDLLDGNWAQLKEDRIKVMERWIRSTARCSATTSAEFPYMVLTDVEMIKQCFVRNASTFHDRPPFPICGRPFRKLHYCA